MSDGRMSDGVQGRIDTYWNGRAADYDAFQQSCSAREDDRQVWRDVWAAALPTTERRAWDVLDVGTGSGHVARVLAGLGHRVTGIDSARAMLDLARRHASTMSNPPDFRLGDAVDPTLPDAAYDAVVSRYLLWTLREPDAALDRWRRLLRPGGLLAAVDSTWFPGGLTEVDDDFTTSYADDVLTALPLATATSIDATVERISQAGYTDVLLTPLTAVLDLDRRHGVDAGHEVQLKFLITARSPA